MLYIVQLGRGYATSHMMPNYVSFPKCVKVRMGLRNFFPQRFEACGVQKSCIARILNHKTLHLLILYHVPLYLFIS